MQKEYNGKTVFIVLNWEGWKDTVECLESIFQVQFLNYQVVVVDNNSKDNSIEKIKEWAKGKIPVQSKYLTYTPDCKPISYAEVGLQDHSAENARLILMKLPANIGFARGNNAGIRYALLHLKSDHIMILNNDTVIYRDSLMQLIDVFKNDPNIGLVGPKIIDYFTGIHWQGVAYKRLSVMDNILYFTPLMKLVAKTPIGRINLVKGETPLKVYGIAGCCMLFRTKVLEEIGMFDETTFLGWEEYIIAEKLLNKGYSTYVVPKATILHKVARDTVKIEPVEKTIIFMKSEIYFQKQYLKWPFYKRAIIKLVRLLIFVVGSLAIASYRRNLARLIKVLFEREN